MNVRQYKGVCKGVYQFKGSTCIGILEDESITGADYKWLKLYQHPQYYLDKAPMVEVPYFVVDHPIRWY